MNEASVISISFRATPDQMVRAHELHWQTSRRYWNLALFAFGMVLILYVIYRGVIGPFSRSEFTALVIGLFLIFGRRVVNRWSLRRHYRNRKDLDHEIHWQISEEGLNGSTGEIAKAQLNWSGISKVLLGPLGFLVYQNDRMFYLWPREAFLSNQDFEFAKNVCKRKVNNYEEIKGEQFDERDSRAS